MPTLLMTLPGLSIRMDVANVVLCEVAQRFAAFGHHYAQPNIAFRKVGNDRLWSISPLVLVAVHARSGHDRSHILAGNPKHPRGINRTETGKQGKIKSGLRP
jgi:hypothetical protein